MLTQVVSSTFIKILEKYFWQKAIKRLGLCYHCWIDMVVLECPLYYRRQISIYGHDNLIFPGGSDGKESACSAGNQHLIPELGRSPGEENGNPLQYSCLESSMDRGAWGRKESDMTEWLTLSLLGIEPILPPLEVWSLNHWEVPIWWHFCWIPLINANDLLYISK